MENDLSKKKIIIDAAYEVFKKYGYEKTSVNDIAKEANMGKGSIYYYFESKEDIFITTLDYEIQTGMTNLQEYLKTIEDPIKRIEEALLQPLTMVSKSPLLMQIWNNKSQFMNKLEEFKNEKHYKLSKILSECIIYAKERKVLIEDFDVDEFTKFIVKWFYMGDDEVSFKLTKEILENILKDFKIMTKYILYGILKRS